MVCEVASYVTVPCLVQFAPGCAWAPTASLQSLFPKYPLAVWLHGRVRYFQCVMLQLQDLAAAPWIFDSSARA